MSAPDKADRDLARLSLEKSVVVEAGAGTGKTTLLTDRIMFLVLAGEKPARVEEVVALTFTEKAAGEIKVRLSERLAELAARLSGEAVSPEAAEGGPIGLLHEGDVISIDLTARTLDVELRADTLESRAREWQPQSPKFKGGWLARYAAMVTSAHTGAVLAVPEARATPVIAQTAAWHAVPGSRPGIRFSR